MVCDACHAIPIHEIAIALGPKDCKLQPFLHAFSGKDGTSFLHGVGKSKLLRHRKSVEYGKVDVNDNVTTTAAYAGRTFVSLIHSLHAHTFLSGKSRDLRSPQHPKILYSII